MATNNYPATPISQIHGIVEGTRKAFRRGPTNDLAYRKANLRALNKFIVENRDALLQALYQDLRKPAFEGEVFELDFVQAEIALALEQLPKWIKPKKAENVHIAHATDNLYTVREPLGTALIIGAWNFPFNLTLTVLVGALAAGNVAVIKPSELAPACASAMEKLLPKYFANGEVSVVNGGPEETTSLLMHRFEKIFYTGNGAVGKIILKAAAEHLTPVTLELGGKSPVFVTDDADPALVAQRLAWGKCVNAGQICVSPDYVLCSKKMQDILLPEFKRVVKSMYGEDQQKSDSYPRIVNNRHFHRVKGLIDASKPKVALGGSADEKDRYIEFTVLKDVTEQDKIMQDEIFGPVLPIITVPSVDDAIKFVGTRDKPLALYIFSSNDADIQNIIQNTSSGSICVNDVAMQICTHSLPFGGVGGSGQGRYHGKYSYDTFTHEKAIMYKGATMEKYVVEKINALRYAPYTATKLSYLRMLFARNLQMTDSPLQGALGKIFKLALPIAILAALVWKFNTQR